MIMAYPGWRRKNIGSFRSFPEGLVAGAAPLLMDADLLVALGAALETALFDFLLPWSRAHRRSSCKGASLNFPAGAYEA